MKDFTMAHKTELIAGCLALACASSAAAAVTTYTDRAAWEAAVSETITLIDFNAQTTSPHYLEAGPWGAGNGPYDAGPFTITEEGTQGVGSGVYPTGWLGSKPSNINNTPALYMSLGFESDQGESARMTQFTFDQPIAAIGMDVLALDSNWDLELRIDGVDGVNYAAPTASAGFFGLVSTDPISQIQFRGSYFQGALVDNIAVAAVPEPSSLALLGLGGLLIARRRRG